MAPGVGGDTPGPDAARAERAPASRDQGRLAAGTVLNNIWRVRRLHASGGMSEVYEGLHVNTDERVAIKVLLAHFAADPKVRGLLLSEARKMTRIRHEAVVHYIMMAEEPNLGVSYIVMDYIDGVGLDKMIGVIRPTQDELVALMRRLAGGLRAAHERGVFHRDISPDNILLPDRRLADAKIIDFGIAKDIDASHSIIGDSFAGKIGFVAPEQFGEFDRSIGPWTDIYSLGLVMLSLALGKSVDMGSTLVEAVDRRRAGPDLTGLTPALRPVFERMLAANPEARLRSMDALIEALGAVSPADSGRAAAEATSGAAADRSAASGLALSYAPGDRALAEQIVRGLRGLGVEVWWDEDSPQVDWQAELERRISDLDGMIVLWTPNSVGSNAVQDEAHLAIAHGKLVNVLAGAPRPPSPFDEANRLYLDGWDGIEPHPGWTQLVQAVEALVVRAGRAQPGEITGVLVKRERELAARRRALAEAQAAFQAGQDREREAGVAAKTAAAALAPAEDDLKRVVEMRVSPSILRVAQQEFDSSRAAKDEAERAHQAAQGDLGGASRQLSMAKANLDTLLLDAVAPPSQPTEFIAAPPRGPDRPSPASPDVATRLATPPPPGPAPPGPISTVKPEPRRQATVNSLAALALLVIAAGLLFGIYAVATNGSHGAFPSATSPAVSAAPPAAPPATDASTAAAVQAAGVLVGAWAPRGLSCYDPVTIAINDGVLALTASGRTSTAAIQSNPQPGVFETQAGDGVYSYTLDQNGLLSVVGPSGPVMQMTKCAG